VSLNFGFYTGDFSDPSHHHPYELFAALVVSLICTVMKFGDRTQFGSTVLASSLVVDLLLIAAAVIWARRPNHIVGYDGKHKLTGRWRTDCELTIGRAVDH